MTRLTSAFFVIFSSLVIRKFRACSEQRSRQTNHVPDIAMLNLVLLSQIPSAALSEKPISTESLNVNAYIQHFFGFLQTQRTLSPITDCFAIPITSSFYPFPSCGSGVVCPCKFPCSRTFKIFPIVCSVLSLWVQILLRRFLLSIDCTQKPYIKASMPSRIERKPQVWLARSRIGNLCRICIFDSTEWIQCLASFLVFSVNYNGQPVLRALVAYFQTCE